MSKPKNDFLHICRERGFFHQCTDEAGLAALLANGPVTAYIGFDCTGKSLHAGSLLPIMLLRWFQTCGHKPIVLMGGATTKIGDPSGKDETRRILTDEEIADNMKGIRRVFDKYLAFGDGASDATMVNNISWFGDKGYIDFLREVGPHFSINRMLTFDSVKNRLEREHHLSFLEFNYMILQAYDFVHLNKAYNCRIQFGGSDQWGNIVNGVELSRRMSGHDEKRDKIVDRSLREELKHQFKLSEEYADKQLFGLTTPLLTTASGAKMGKTADGAIWLDEAMLSPYEFWQYWRNTEDADVGRFLRLFTELEMSEIKRLEKLEGAEINEAKKILATEVTALCHGRDAAEKAQETARQTFEQGALAENLPTVRLPKSELTAGIPAFQFFVKTHLAASGKEARRLIEQGGAKINDTLVTDATMQVTPAFVSAEGVIKASAGKKKHVLVKPE